jgi:hypothetical protein
LLSLPLGLVNRIAPFPDPPENPQLTPIATSSADKKAQKSSDGNGCFEPSPLYLHIGGTRRSVLSALSVSYFFFPFFFIGALPWFFILNPAIAFLLILVHFLLLQKKHFLHLSVWCTLLHGAQFLQWRR